MTQRIPNAKYWFMVGTSSRVPGRPGWHYLILDIDGPVNPKKVSPSFGIRQQTESGWHIYTPHQFRLKKMLAIAVAAGSDPVWARLALERGWAFLADKSPVLLPWPVERMILGWNRLKESKQRS